MISTANEEDAFVACERLQGGVQVPLTGEVRGTSIVLDAVVHAAQRCGTPRAGDAVEVVNAPGTFGRVRMGVVTAQALAWALDGVLLVSGKRVSHVVPNYGKPPATALST